MKINGKTNIGTKTTRSVQTLSFRRRLCGFSLIEVLLALLLFAGAMLALVTTEVQALQLMQSVANHSAAERLGSALKEAMQANPVASLDGKYEDAVAPNFPPVTDCHLRSCTAEQLAHFDLRHFREGLSHWLPGPAASCSEQVLWVPLFAIGSMSSGMTITAAVAGQGV